MNHELPDRNYRQEAYRWVDNMESLLGLNLNAMREHILRMDDSQLGPLDPDEMANHILEPQSPGDSFRPELLVEGLPEVIVFEN